MTPPLLFVSRLAAYDPELRVRWAPRLHRWAIERKMPERHKQLLAERPNPWKSARGQEVYEGWRQGYVLVMFVDPSLLHWSIVEPALADCDTWKQDGFEAINRKLDAAQEAWDRETDKLREVFAEDAGKEAADRMMWLGGHRMAMPFAEPAETMFTVEHHDGFMVRSKRHDDR